MELLEIIKENGLFNSVIAGLITAFILEAIEITTPRIRVWFMSCVAKLLEYWKRSKKAPKWLSKYFRGRRLKIILNRRKKIRNISGDDTLVIIDAKKASSLNAAYILSVLLSFWFMLDNIELIAKNMLWAVLFSAPILIPQFAYLSQQQFSRDVIKSRNRRRRNIVMKYRL